MSGAGRAPTSGPGAPTSPSARVGTGSVGVALRVPAFVVVSSLLGVAAHAAAEQALPDPRLLALAVLAAGLSALPLARHRERSFEAITGLLLLGQAAVHAVLCLAHGLPTAAAGTTHAAHMSHPGMAMPATGYLGHLYPGHTMLLTHLLAAGVAGWWLRRGEAAVWEAASRVLRAFTLPRRVVVPVAAPRPRPAASGVRVLHDQVSDGRSHPRRGPPARLAPAFAPSL